MKKALHTLSMILVPAAATLPALTAYGLPADFYAANSKMAQGKWVKIKVSAGGMNVITDAQLRQAGFTNPQNVHVFGRGGRQLGYGLTKEDHDDLPLIPSVRTAKGLVFFAADHYSWAESKETPYEHSIHEFDDNTYYFISDIPVESTEMEAAPTTAAAAENSRTVFTERLVHEQELEPAGESGCQIYGEDFRSKKNQTFSFTLPDMADDKAKAYVRFAAKATGPSSLIFTANGDQLPSTERDKIQATTDINVYCAINGPSGKKGTIKEISGLDGKLDLGIDYTYSGVLFKARLDYIELFYDRRTAINQGELHFYGNLKPGEGFTVSGCSDQTVIWDVTDPVAPRKVDYALDGDKASFTCTYSGYREFVAFNPESVNRATTTVGNVANQDIHGMETPDMVIITLPEYRQGAERLAALHTEHDGMRVAVLDADAIYNEFSGGKKDVGAFRRMLKMWYDRGESRDRHKLQYCILMGKPSYDNKMVSASVRGAGYTPLPIWQSYTGLMEADSYCTDDIIAMLDDVTETGFNMNTAMLRVAVGRFPVTSAQEALDMAAKVEKYVKEPNLGSWRNRVMLIADDDDNAQHFNQAQKVYDNLRSGGNGSAFLYDRVYLDSYPRVMTGVGATYPQATERMMRNYNDGVMMTDYIGHASAVGWGHEHLWEWESITSMTNKNLTFIYAATCGFAYWDKPSFSGAEHLLLNPESGVIGLMAATRTVYISPNGDLNFATMSEFFARDTDGGPRTFGDVYVRGKNNCTDAGSPCNRRRYAFLGDPAIRIPSATHNVSVSTINDTDISTATAENYPELPAMSTVRLAGEITDAKGNLTTDFNGTLNLQLYDAERVITTLGQGKNGQVKSYNDRDSRLAATNTEVKGGRWQAVLRVPPEIQGNYTPALISGYAWSDKGTEANGACEKLYVYGYDESATDDTEGPEIEYFYVNSPNVGPESVVNRNLVVFAQLRDKSGINISQSGIGHSLLLTVDDTDFHSGLNAYFEQDATDPDLGTIVYPLDDVEPGRHTLTLTAWDNANNVSKASIEINVGASVEPTIYDITASTSAASESVDFRIMIDRPNTAMKCSLGIYDLNGRKMWETDETLSSDLQSIISTRWDLTDTGGNRVPRGIYIYRATLESPEGTCSSKSKKIAVTAQ